jgi:osmotically-inducible protein OsmY
VETVDGVVYLRGTVPGLEDTDLAAEVAARVPGVVDVVDEMTVQE